MENLTRLIDQAIQCKDYDALCTMFSPIATSSSSSMPSWHILGQGEKRSLASYLISAVMMTTVSDNANAAPPTAATAAASSSSFLTPAAFERLEDVLIAALGHLPATGVEGAADNKLRQLLFEYKISQEDYGGAARILGGMRMNDDNDDMSSPYYMTPHEKADVYVRMAECFLAEDEIAEADAAVNKAGSVVSLIRREKTNTDDNEDDNEDDNGNDHVTQQKHQGLLLRYKSTYARVLDANRKFLQAAQRYHELSAPSSFIDADESLQMLGRAATCAILAPSGPQRQRVLGQIYRDDRLLQLDRLEEYETHATILTKMYSHQILQKRELVRFESSLAEHQKAVMGDGLTIMERGVVEHNMIAIRHVYRSIYVSELARILGVSSTVKAEKIAATMILEGSLKGRMDQVSGLLEFEPEEAIEQAWDRSINNFCVELNRVTDAIKTATL